MLSQDLPVSGAGELTAPVGANALVASLRDSGGVEVWSVWLPRGKWAAAGSDGGAEPESRRLASFLHDPDGLPIPEAPRGQRQTIPI